MKHYMMAECQQCVPILPQEFPNELGRDQWADAHEAQTEHDVKRWVEIDEDGPDG